MPLKCRFATFTTGENLWSPKKAQIDTEVKAHPPSHAKLHSKAVVWGTEFGKHPLRNTLLALFSANLLHDVTGYVQVLVKSFKLINTVIWEKESGLPSPKLCIWQWPRPDTTLQEDMRPSLLVSVFNIITDQRWRLLFRAWRLKKMRFHLSWEVLCLLIFICTSTPDQSQIFSCFASCEQYRTQQATQGC